MGPSDNGKGNC